MTVEEIIAKHKSNGTRVCYAPTLEPITATHTGSGTVSAKVFRCTRPLGHTDEDRRGGTGTGSMHRDGNCCWSPHYYSDNMAGDPEPEHHNWERCVECGRDWPCDVEKIRLASLEGMTFADQPA